MFALENVDLLRCSAAIGDDILVGRHLAVQDLLAKVLLFGLEHAVSSWSTCTLATHATEEGAADDLGLGEHLLLEADLGGAVLHVRGRGACRACLLSCSPVSALSAI